MEFDADRDPGPLGDPSLGEMADTAVRVLQRNPNGFFLLVESKCTSHNNSDISNRPFRTSVLGLHYGLQRLSHWSDFGYHHVIKYIVKLTTTCVLKLARTLFSVILLSVVFTIAAKRTD